MAVLIPRAARRKLAAAIETGSRTSSEVASSAKLPDHYVGIWLQVGEEVENMLTGLLDATRQAS